MTRDPDNMEYNLFVIRRGLLACVFLIAVLVTFLGLNGSATRFDTSTWVAAEEGEPIKHTRVTHSWWMGLPAIAPMDASFTDGEFQVETKAVNLPTIDIGTLFERDK